MMMKYLYELPQQFRDSLDMNIEFARNMRNDYHHILVSGLGGSAIGGDILRSYATQKANIPIIVNRDYNMPAFINKNSLVFIVSYSGNTEETISAYRQAKEKGADIICISSGGEISEMAKKDSFPLVEVPSGLAPRAASGYLFAPLALILERMGILKDVSEDLDECMQLLSKTREKLSPNVDIKDNLAKQLAAKLKDSIPLIWGASGSTEVAALRWKAQLNENAKCPAYYNAFPELNHNEIVGFELTPDILVKLFIIILRDENDHPQVKKRMDISRDIVKDKIKGIFELYPEGKSFLAKFYYLCYIGDYTSTYLALEYGINPTPVKIIDYLKAELAK